jgi:hypothetical protein
MGGGDDGATKCYITSSFVWLKNQKRLSLAKNIISITLLNKMTGQKYNGVLFFLLLLVGWNF